MRYKEEETLESYRKRMNPYKTWKNRSLHV